VNVRALGVTDAMPGGSSAIDTDTSAEISSEGETVRGKGMPGCRSTDAAERVNPAMDRTVTKAGSMPTKLD